MSKPRNIKKRKNEPNNGKVSKYNEKRTKEILWPEIYQLSIF